MPLERSIHPLLPSLNAEPRSSLNGEPRSHEEKMALQNKPEGLARIDRIQNEKMVIRINDFNRLDFWMEVELPLEQIISLLEENSYNVQKI